MMCSGKVYCKIYRDKKYCRKEHEENWNECDCRHAAKRCEVDYCAFSDRCTMFDQMEDDAWKRERHGEWRGDDGT